MQLRDPVDMERGGRVQGARHRTATLLKSALLRRQFIFGGGVSRSR